MKLYKLGGCIPVALQVRPDKCFIKTCLFKFFPQKSTIYLCFSNQGILQKKNVILYL